MTMQAIGQTPGPKLIEQWCGALNLQCVQTLTSDYQRPLSIDGIGRYSFETPGKADTASLESIGVQGSF